MKRYIPILLIFTCIGFLWSCETTDPLVNDVELSLITGDYESAMETVNNAIDVDQNNYTAHFYKGIILSSQASETESPEERQPLYERAKQSYDTAKELMQGLEETPAELEELNSTVTSYWAEEYNVGVNYQNDDSLFNSTPEPYRASLAHLKNAATVNPDSAMTYQVISSTHFQLQEIDDAISSYETAMSLLETPAADDYEYLVSLYLFDDRYPDAISYSEEALDQYPDSTIFVQFLADAYIQSGERETAVELVEGLIAEDPENPQYRRVLGTQVYQNVERLTGEVADLYQQRFDLVQQSRGESGDQLEQTEQQIATLDGDIAEMEQAIDDQTEISIQQMKKVVELQSNDESANFILGIIYQNRAANLFERRNNTTDNAEANELDEMARDVLRESLTYYERAAEINPDNPENWQSLFQVYTTLNMEEEAEEAMRRAGFDE